MRKTLEWIRGHLSSLSSVMAIVLTVTGTLLASDIIPTDSTVAHVLGFVMVVLTTLGFKALPPISVPDSQQSTKEPIQKP